MANFHKYGRLQDEPRWDEDELVFYFSPSFG